MNTQETQKHSLIYTTSSANTLCVALLYSHFLITERSHGRMSIDKSLQNYAGNSMDISEAYPKTQSEPHAWGNSGYLNKEYGIAMSTGLAHAMCSRSSLSTSASQLIPIQSSS